jgi:prepilin-type N-terminal cleavage/methylation domain-containing protein
MLERFKDPRAFTLMELSIALLIFLIGILGLLQLVVVSISINQRNRDITLATSLAQERADDLMRPDLIWTSVTLQRGGSIPTAPNTNPLAGGNPAPVSGYADFLDYNGLLLPTGPAPLGTPLTVPADTYFVREWQICDGCGGATTNCAAPPAPDCSPVILKSITVTVTAMSPAFRGSYPATTVSVYRAKLL